MEYRIHDWAEAVKELKPIAHNLLRNERPDHTLQATALVNEILMKVYGPNWRERAWEDRRAFFAACKAAGRRLLVDAARRRRAQKRGGDWNRVPLDDGVGMALAAPARLDQIDGLLDQMAEDKSLPHAQRCAEVVEYKVFVELRAQDIGILLGVSRETVQRDWREARVWLAKRLDNRG